MVAAGPGESLPCGTVFRRLAQIWASGDEDLSQSGGCGVGGTGQNWKDLWVIGCLRPGEERGSPRGFLGEACHRS